MPETSLDVPDWPPTDDPTAPDDSGRHLLDQLAGADARADEAGDWSEDLWRILVELGAPRWSLPAAQGGFEVARDELVRRYAILAESSLTAAFILTQHDAALRRLIGVEGAGGPTAAGWLRAIGEGRAFLTVGISQLTTSRRHGPRALVARRLPGGGYRLDGAMPWVTAAKRADAFVTGAVLEDDRQLVAVVPADRDGLTVHEPFPLAALQASCTSEVTCDGVEIGAEDMLLGPSDDLSSAPGLAGTGGLETSALALGQARAALVALARERVRREDLAEPVEVLNDSWAELSSSLCTAARGEPVGLAPPEIRARANSLVLRTTQAYLTARKGTGFLRGEPAQRWARQALFFLVWSCPTPVAQSTLRDLAGLCPRDD